MDHKPGKRRLTWFRNNRPGAPNTPNTPAPPITPINPKAPNTLGRMWRREPQAREKTDSWLLQEPQAPDKPPPLQAGLDQLPDLPAWPPLPEESQFPRRKASYDSASTANTDDIANPANTYDTSGGYPYTDEYAAPIQGQPDAPQDHPRGEKLRALWGKATTKFRRPRLALAVVAGSIALCAILGVAALSAASFHNKPSSAQGSQGAGNANSAVVSPTGGQATPSVAPTDTAAPANTQPPTKLAITFNCASGVAGGTGQLCVHTLPNAALSLSVRYCDGSYAKGKDFHGVSYADGSGNYTWRWNVNTTCIGAATATVTAKSAGQTVTQNTTFTITR